MRSFLEAGEQEDGCVSRTQESLDTGSKIPKLLMLYMDGSYVCTAHMD